MANPRSEVVHEGVEGLYHCFTRCVRHAFLCGYDQYSGHSYKHRREWIRSKLKRIFTHKKLAKQLKGNEK